MFRQHLPSEFLKLVGYLDKVSWKLGTNQFWIIEFLPVLVYSLLTTENHNFLDLLELPESSDDSVSQGFTTDNHKAVSVLLLNVTQSLVHVVDSQEREIVFIFKLLGSFCVFLVVALRVCPDHKGKFVRIRQFVYDQVWRIELLVKELHFRSILVVGLSFGLHSTP